MQNANFSSRSLVNRILIPSVLVVIASIVITMIISFVVAQKLNTLEAKEDRELVSNEINQYFLDAISESREWSRWGEFYDEMITKKHVNNNNGRIVDKWTRENLGPWLKNQYRIHYIFVIDGNNNTKYSSMDDNENIDATYKQILPNIDDLIAKTRNAVMSDSIPAIDYVIIDNQLYLVAISAMNREKPTPEELIRHNRPVQMFVLPFDQTRLQIIADATKLRNLHFAKPGDNLSKFNSIDLKDRFGNSVATIAWSYNHGGDKFILSLLPWFIILLIVIILGSIYFYITMQKATKIAAQKDRMACLGSLVSVIANGIKYPIYTCVDSIDEIHAIRQKLYIKFKDNLITKKELMEDITNIIINIDTITDNLDTAIADINTFSEISAERHISYASLNLKQHINDILTSLKIKWKHKQLDIDFSCPDNLTTYIENSTLYYIFRTLLSNTLKYAYAENEVAQIKINVTQTNNLIHLTYLDKGKGMEQEKVDSIFELKLKHEDNKLSFGMYIISVLVTEKLSGTISCESTIGNGTKVEIIFPLLRRNK